MVPKLVTFISFVTLIPLFLSVDVERSSFPLLTVLIPPTVWIGLVATVPSSTDLVGSLLEVGLIIASRVDLLISLPSSNLIMVFSVLLTVPEKFDLPPKLDVPVIPPTSFLPIGLLLILEEGLSEALEINAPEFWVNVADLSCESVPIIVPLKSLTVEIL